MLFVILAFWIQAVNENDTVLKAVRSPTIAFDTRHMYSTLARSTASGFGLG